MNTKVEILAYRQRVKEIGQKINFQIQLPSDAKRIIGIEHSGMTVAGTHVGFVLVPGDPFLFFPDKLIGRLTLHVPGREGIFYQTEVKEHRNISYGEPLAGIGWNKPVWVMSTRRDPIDIKIDGVSFIEGYFEDAWGNFEYTSLEYMLNIFLWIELE